MGVGGSGNDKSSLEKNSAKRVTFRTAPLKDIDCESESFMQGFLGNAYSLCSFNAGGTEILPRYPSLLLR